MGLLETLSRQATWQLARAIDWALTNWVITIVMIAALIYWAGRQRRLNRHHL